MSYFKRYWTFYTSKLFQHFPKNLIVISGGQNWLIPYIVLWRNLKFFFSRTTEPISTKLGTKHSWRVGNQSFSNKNHSILKKEIMDFPLSNSTIWYKHRFAQMFRLIWTGFSGERCGPWASSYGYLMSLLCIMCIITLFLGMESSLYKE